MSGWSDEESAASPSISATKTQPTDTWGNDDNKEAGDRDGGFGGRGGGRGRGKLKLFVLVRNKKN